MAENELDCDSIIQRLLEGNLIYLLFGMLVVDVRLCHCVRLLVDVLVT